MFGKIPKIDIRLPRNRLFEACISILDIKGKKYRLQSGESLIFGVKFNDESTDYDIQKIITSANATEDDSYLLVLSTKMMNIPAGQYYYDIALKTADGELVQVIDISTFEVTESVVQSE